MTKIRFLSRYTIFLLTLLVSACTHSGAIKHMQAVAKDQVVTVPDPGKSMIIFMRPFNKGWTVQSSIFEITEQKPKLVGIVASMKKLAYQFDPGEHFFMVLGENADFMLATLEENRTYFVLIIPKMGWWKARFSFKPIHAHKLNSKELVVWLERCQWVGKNSDSEQWSQNNMKSIQFKYHDYIDDWTQSNESDKPKLKRLDGKLNLAVQTHPLKLEDIGLENYYSPQDAVDPLDSGDDEYYSPQDLKKPAVPDLDIK